MRIHTQSIGKPRTAADSRGEWRSAIFREPVAGPVALGERSLAGDRVADTKHHGAPDQAVCCHPLAHYAHWNAVFAPAEPIPPGAVGENWTIDGAEEGDVCIGDVWAVGDAGARVQVSAPRFPCWKQERKVGIPGFLKAVTETMRTGWYVRVLAPGPVRAGDLLTLEARPNPGLTVAKVNAGLLPGLDPALARELLAVPELAEGWKRMLRKQLDRAA